MDDDRRDALCEAAIEAARTEGARYAEARLVEGSLELLDVRDGRLGDATRHDDTGLGVRVLVGDALGYGATPRLTREGAAEAARNAVRAARAVGDAPGAPPLVPAPVERDWAAPVDEDPFEMSPDAKAAPVADAQTRMMRRDGVFSASGLVQAIRRRTHFRASNGSRLRQTVTLCGGRATAIARDGDRVQTRSHADSWDGNVLQGGFEHVRALELPARAEELADEAVALTRAEPTPEEQTTLVLAGSQLGLQIHESIGHPTELDRILGHEISLAGGSFLTPEDVRGGARFGSEQVTVVADPTAERGPGTFAFDDEGTPATPTTLIDRGRLVGALSGRTSAARLDAEAGSCSRATGWARPPVDRMTNVNLAPGEGSLDDLVAGVDRGLLIEVNRSWSIDHLRLNFQFGCEIAREIRGGRLTGRIFRDPVYHGVTPTFWGSCSAVAGPEAWRIWGFPWCGKGDPPQLLYVGHGCAPARFDGVAVRSA